MIYVCALISPHHYNCADGENDTVSVGTVRLVGGSIATEGRIEVYHFGQWGTVCSTHWDLFDATVVCHQLGYIGAVGAPVSSAFGAGSGPSWYSYVRCTGTEHKLTECDNNGITGKACPHSQDAGVMCSSEVKGGVQYM